MRTSQMTTFMNESIQGVEILRLFHAEQQSRKEFQNGMNNIVI